MQRKSIIQELIDLRDGVVTNVAAFQNTWNKTTCEKLKIEVELLKSKLQEDMDTYALDHTLKLQSTLTDLKQELKTELFIELFVEKNRLSNEFTTELRGNVTDWKTNTCNPKYAKAKATSICQMNQNHKIHMTHMFRITPLHIHMIHMITVTTHTYWASAPPTKIQRLTHLNPWVFIQLISQEAITQS